MVLKKKDKAHIPSGNYCYKWIEVPDPANGYVGKTKPCPFYGHRMLSEISIPWCYFLDKGGLPNSDLGQDWSKLVSHFGTEKNVYRELPLTLLWDGVKECGENESGEL
jgi:hypothetical protein